MGESRSLRLRNHLMLKMFWFFNLESLTGLICTGIKNILSVSVLKNVKSGIFLVIKLIFMVVITQISGSVMEIIPRFCLSLKIHV